MNKINFSKIQKRISNPDILVTDLSEYEKYFHDATEESGTPIAILFAESDNDII